MGVHPKEAVRGRFAPSPTGYIHLGNLWIALLSYVSVKQRGGTYVLRIEDIDQARSKALYGEALLDDLEWMGLTWDEGPRVGGPYGPYVQSERMDLYEKILDDWRQEGIVYGCFCSRARLHQLSSAPHEGEERLRYDGHCRSLSPEEVSLRSQEKEPAWRLALDEWQGSFADRWQGHQSFHLLGPHDDFILARGPHMAYQLAVSVDDAFMAIDEVIRGRDLLSSTPLQAYVMDRLGYAMPRYGHAPLLLDGEGHRLSKRQGGITIRELYQGGLTAGAIWANLAEATHLLPKRDGGKRYRSLTVDDFLEGVDLNSFGKEDITLTNFDISV